ncbi:hypothetical protein [Flavobacterium chilense]|uniref:Uncharacterized protein n=1 Tax=Flavobacterium chilense TaxID=946677 RepID=A0A1M7J933_9FLAO|nr:hypothetical protein [Flavobacterium chilense]SHM49516.1 hypothetical protein SAMN05444484_106229 [Flavobacterium chilense]
MIEDVLTNFVYLYYPKNVCPWDERDKYLKTVEYNRLRKIIDYFDSEENLRIRDNIKKEFENDIVLKEFQDFSTLDGCEDRCFTFFLNIFENGELLSISLHISLLLPYYVIRRGWHHAELWFTKEKIEELETQNLDSRKMDDIILDIEKIVEEKLLYQKFPQTLMNTIISDIGFQDIYIGHFKMYNGFFNNQNI